MLEEAGDKFHTIVTIEDGVTAGGLYGEICEYFAGKDSRPKIVCLGVPDRFIEQGTQSQEKKECGFDPDGIYMKIYEEMQKSYKKD